MGGSKLNKNRFRKHKNMITNSDRNTSATSKSPGVVKSTPLATASVSSLNAGKSTRSAPSQTMIAQKAYELWLSQGQKPGCDQKHWFEAEQQLQRA
jgi:DUF2934 family protein